jgi:hypothetical protein
MKFRLLALIPALSLGGCYGLYGNDEMDRYFQRSETITMSAGDAKEVNATTHMITPWPRYVGDRRIAYSARRTGAAVTRYGNTSRPVDQLPDEGDPTRAMGQPPPTVQDVNVTGLAGSGGVAVPVGGPTR